MTDKKDPIDPSPTPGNPEDDKPRWKQIRQTLSGSNNKNNNNDVDKERRSTIAKTGAAAGALGIIGGLGGAAAYDQFVRGRAGPAIIADDEEEPPAPPEDDEEMDQIQQYLDRTERRQIPGPYDEEGYRIEEELLREYNEAAWEDIASEEEYDELGTGTEWYIIEDGSVVGVNERQQRTRVFPTDEFPQNEDYEQLYNDLEEAEE